MYSQFVEHGVIKPWDLAVDWPTSYDAHLQALWHPQHNVVVQDVEGIVYGINSQVCRPFQTYLQKQSVAQICNVIDVLDISYDISSW